MESMLAHQGTQKADSTLLPPLRPTLSAPRTSSSVITGDKIGCAELSARIMDTRSTAAFIEEAAGCTESSSPQKNEIQRHDHFQRRQGRLH